MPTKTKTLIREPVPVLDTSSGEPNLDWIDGSYKATVTKMGNGWVAVHKLEGAPGVLKSLDAGDAAYAVEIRCPRTQFTTLVTDASREMHFSYPEHETYKDVFMIPGVVAVKDCSLDLTGTSKIWRKGNAKKMHVSCGQWLVRGPGVKEDVAKSMLAIKVSDHLSPGEMSAGLNTDADGNVQVMINISQDQRERSMDAAFVCQAWQTAMALLPSRSVFKLDDDGMSDNDYVMELIHKLETVGITTLWDEPDHWDPIKAATSILAMPALERKE